MERIKKELRKYGIEMIENIWMNLIEWGKIGSISKKIYLKRKELRSRINMEKKKSNDFVNKRMIEKIGLKIGEECEDIGKKESVEWVFREL